MKLLSIDVGIKNLSFCLFQVSEGEKDKEKDKEPNLSIIKWDNIDLTEKTNEVNKCIVITDKNELCNKPAKFSKGANCYCLKHSKKQPFLQLPSELKSSFINKQKLQSLADICKKYNIPYATTSKKAELIKNISEFVEQKCFTAVEKNNATKVDLVTIGRNIQHKFDDIFYSDTTDTIDTIIIENQIGPIANKMKTIQGMISQYFIMKNNNIKIEFISASNKLKDFTPIPIPILETTETKCKLDYKQRKQLGVKTTLHFVDSDERFSEWSSFLHKHNKKDDLSDCFLQGMWFIKHKI